MQSAGRNQWRKDRSLVVGVQPIGDSPAPSHVRNPRGVRALDRKLLVGVQEEVGRQPRRAAASGPIG